MAWTDDVRLFKGYDERDPRPPTARALELAQKVCRERGLERIGLELSQGTQTADRMLGEPTTPTLALLRGVREPRSTRRALLAEARAIKTEQEVERMRLANELAALALEHVQRALHAGHDRGQVAAMWEGAVHAIGTGYRGKGRERARLRARLVGARASRRSRRRATARSPSTSRRCSRSGSAPTATGATTRRTSARASSTRATSSSSSSCSTCTTAPSRTAATAPTCPSSTG